MTPIVGSIVALVTPMHEDGSVDYDTLRALIDWHIAEGTNCIGVVGTTGESPTVTVEEQAEIIRAAVEHAKGRVPIMAGAGANSTAEAIELSRYAKQVGADCTLQVVPYYNKPTQEGMCRHFEMVAERGGLPVILYNVPGRTVADLSNESVLRLAQVPNIIGLKESTGDIPRVSDLLARVPEDFAVYSGNDDCALALIGMGGHGTISVTANVAPGPMARMCEAALARRWDEALAINRRLLPLHFKLFVEANPIPVKWALAEMGKIENGIRLPMTPLDPRYHDVVRQALQDSGVIPR